MTTPSTAESRTTSSKRVVTRTSGWAARTEASRGSSRSHTLTNRAPLSWANIRTWFLPHSPAPTTATQSGLGPVVVMAVPSLEIPALEDQAGQDQQDRRIGRAVRYRGNEVGRFDGQSMHCLPLDVEVLEVRKQIVEPVQDRLSQALAQLGTQCPQIIGEMADHINGQREGRAQGRSGERGEHHRHRRDHQELHEDQSNCLQQRKAQPCLADEDGQKEPRRHDANVHQERKRQARVLSEEIQVPGDWFRNDRKDRPLLDLLADQADPDEDCNDDAEDIDAGQSYVLNDLDLLANGERAEEDRAADQEQAEEHQVVENLVAQRLAKGVHGDHGDPVHARPTSTVSLRKRSSSERLCGTSDTSRPP